MTKKQITLVYFFQKVLLM